MSAATASVTSLPSRMATANRAKSLTLEMIPLLILFESSIWIAYWMERRRRKNGTSGDGFEGFAPATGSEPEAETEPEPEAEEPLFVEPVRRDPRDRDDV